MFEGMPRPLTEDEVNLLMANTVNEIQRTGLWGKLCAHCGTGIGGRLAKYGKPTPAELQYCACPMCGAVGEVRLDYVPGEGE